MGQYCEIDTVDCERNAVGKCSDCRKNVCDSCSSLIKSKRYCRDCFLGRLHQSVEEDDRVRKAGGDAAVDYKRRLETFQAIYAEEDQRHAVAQADLDKSHAAAKRMFELGYQVLQDSCPHPGVYYRASALGGSGMWTCPVCLWEWISDPREKAKEPVKNIAKVTDRIVRHLVADIVSRKGLDLGVIGRLLPRLAAADPTVKTEIRKAWAKIVAREIREG